MADSLCVTFKNVIKFTSCVPLQSTLPLNGVKSKEMYPRCYHYTVCLSCSGRAQVVRYHRCNSCRSCLFSRNISITVSSEAPSPLRYVLPYLYRLYYLHSSSVYLFLVSVSNASGCICLCVCHPPFSFLPPSPSQTVDWYGDTRLHVFLALPQMGPWQHVRDQNVLYLSCQAVPRDQNGSRPLLGGGRSFPSSNRGFYLLLCLLAWLNDFYC